MANGDSNFQLPPGLIPTLPQVQLPPVTVQDLSALLGMGKRAIPQTMAGPSEEQQRSGRQPATVRYNNPGGMWEGPSASKFGSTSHGILSDGNHIAYFETPEQGAAAQFDLLASRKYVNREIGPLIDEWSGSTGGRGNVSAYAAQVASSIGMSPGDRLTEDILRSPAGISLAKAQAHWETGYNYPMSDEQWQNAQRMAFGESSMPLVAQANVSRQAPAQQPQQMTVNDLLRQYGY